MLTRTLQSYEDAADWCRLSHDPYLSIRFLQEGLLRETTSRTSAVVTESSWTVATSTAPAGGQKVTDGWTEGTGRRGRGQTFVVGLQGVEDLADRPHGGLLTDQPDVRARVALRLLDNNI